MLRKTLLVSSAILLAVNFANASDLPSKSSAPALPKGKAYDWSGAYFGVTGGIVQGSDRVTTGCGNVTGLRDEDGMDEVDLCAAQVANLVDLTEITDGPNTGAVDVPTLFIDDESEALAFLSEIANSENSGGYFGVQVGFDHKLSNGLILGGEISGYQFTNVDSSYRADFNFFDDDPDDFTLDDFAGEGAADFSSSLDWLMKATVRLGMPVLENQRGLIYGSLGGAVAQVSVKNDSFFDDVSCSDPCVSYNNGSDFSQFGAVIGGGFEYMVTNNLSLAAEYNYIHMHNPQVISTTFAGTDGSIWTYEYKAGYDDLQLGSIKLNYRF